jgi:Zinc dependent phospholipase C
MRPLRAFLASALSLLLALTLTFATAPPASAYSVLSHEAIIDAAWKDNIRPLLLARFPNATHDQLREAHAYCYGGSIIQDSGYYPYGKKLFSDLTHYVRSGDFIVALLNDAAASGQLNDLAFALGALAHYAADNEGHRLAVNLAVPILYPELKKKFGDTVTYEDDPLAHVKTEFGFDVLEVAKGRYAPDAYHDFIGFAVAQPLLDRAFAETYGLQLSSIMEHESKAIESYRHDVSKLIPQAVKVAWAVKQDDITRDLPGMTRKKFLYNLSRSSYERNWGRDYRRPNFVERLYAFLFRLIPKIGPLRILTFRTPTPETERLFEASFNVTLDRYRALLAAVGSGSLVLPNDNFDVGAATELGKYHLADATYADLLHLLAQQNFSGVSPQLRSTILDYYAASSSPDANLLHPEGPGPAQGPPGGSPAPKSRHRKAAARLHRELAELKSTVSATTPPTAQ